MEELLFQGFSSLVYALHLERAKANKTYNFIKHTLFLYFIQDFWCRHQLKDLIFATGLIIR